MKDTEIIHMIQKGMEDPPIQFLYHKIWPSVLSWIKKNHGSKQEAQDIFQDAILILYKQIKMNKFDPKYEIKGYMFSVCKNLWVNYIKRKGRLEGISEDVEGIHDDFNALTHLVNKEREEFVVQLFANLGERCKELLVLSFYHKYSSQEIAEKLGFGSEDMVKTKKYKCKQRLITLIGDGQVLKGRMI